MITPFAAPAPRTIGARRRVALEWKSTNPTVQRPDKMEEMMIHARILRWLVCALAGLSLLATGCRKSEQAPAPAGSAPVAAAPATAPPPPGPTADNDLVVDKLVVDKQTVDVAHSKFDGGRSEDIFDSDSTTLARTENANPATVELRYSTPRPVKSVTATTGTMDVGLTVTVTPEQGEPKVFTKEWRQLPNDPTVTLELDPKGIVAKKVRVDIKNLNGGDGHIHIRTLKVS